MFNSLPSLAVVARDVWQPTLIVAAIACLLGIVIVIIFKLFAVPTDERFEELLERLPGVNCGGCGYSGCAGYAEALAKGQDTDCTKCAPGGKDTVKELSAYLGMEAPAYVPKVARLACQGSCSHTSKRYEYTGSMSCASATNLFAGPNSCVYGCLGFGDCVATCEFGAMEIKDGIVHINPDRCTACGCCVKACPKSLLSLMPKYTSLYRVACSNTDAGGRVRKVCDIGCIGCRKCQKACNYSAITMKESLAVIDAEKCVHCGACIGECPTHAIVKGLYDVIAEAQEQVA